MKDLFEEIKAIDKTSNKTVEKTVCKLLEETGELAQAVNMTIGMKSHNLTPEQIVDRIAEETADAIQNLFCVAIKCGVPYEAIATWLPQKNEKWKKKIAEEGNE